MKNEVKRKSIGQNRAKCAWEYAEASKTQGDKIKDKYKSHVREFPMLVHTCGLVNAVAFAKEKSDDKGWAMLYEHLENWLKKDCGANHLGEKGLLPALLDIKPDDTQKMRRLTNETISLFTWLKRFVS